MDNPNKSAYLYGRSILDKDSKTIPWEKNDPRTTLQQMILGQLEGHIRKSGTEPLPHYIYIYKLTQKGSKSK